MHASTSRFLFVLISACLIVLIYLARKNLWDHNITFIDVGSGDAVLIELEKARYLIDGGSNSEVDVYLGEKYPLSCYFNAVFATHPHKDHIGGLERILEHCTAAVVVHNQVSFNSVTYQKLISKISTLPQSSVFIGTDLIPVVGCSCFHVLWPPDQYLLGEVDDLNSISTVLLFDYKDFEVLLLGDAENGVQASLPIEDYTYLIDDGLDVLKVGHHGSRDALNKDLLLQLRPKHAVISVGKNSYGHPDPAHVEFLESIGTKVWRTDLDGSIEFRF